MKTTLYDLFKPRERSKQKAMETNRDLYEAINSLPLRSITKEYFFHTIATRPIANGKLDHPPEGSTGVCGNYALSKVIQEFVTEGYNADAIFNMFYEALFAEEYWAEIGNRMELLEIIIELVKGINSLSVDIAVNKGGN